MESFIFYKSFYEAIRNIPKESQLELYNAICEYSFTNELVELEDSIAKAMFILMKPNIDSANARYRASVENGKKGGRPKKKEPQEKPSNNLDKTQEKPNNNPNETQEEPSENLNYNYDYDYNYNLDYNKENNKEKQPDETTTTIYNFLESNFARTISPLEVEKLRGWQEKFNDDILKYGIELCCNANAKNFNYLNAILNNWKSKGFTKLEECKNENLERNTKTNKPIRKEIVPDWFNKETKTKKATKEEIEEMKNLLSEYQDP